MPYESQFTPDKVEEYIKNLNHAIWNKPHYRQQIRRLVKSVDLNKIQKQSEQEVKEVENRCVTETMNAIRNHDFALSSDKSKVIQQKDIDFLCAVLYAKFFNFPKSTSKGIENTIKKMRAFPSSKARPEVN